MSRSTAERRTRLPARLTTGRSLVLIVVVLACAQVATSRGVFAQNPETLQFFDQGNSAYESGEYARAALAYEKALETGYRSAELYYNLGNTYYRLDEVGRSILNYERALLLDPENRAVKHSLDLARTRTMDRMSQLPDRVWTRAWRRVVAGIGVAGVLWVGLLLYLGATALVLYRVLTGARDPWSRRAAAVLAAVGLPVVLTALLVSARAANTPRCVVLAESVEVRVNPEPSAEVDLEIHEGLVVHALAEDSTWFRVRLPNGVTGWIDRSAVEPI